MEKKLSGRAEKALEVLKAGGFFREQLEAHYHGGEKFVLRLRAANRAVVKGVGYQTKIELEKAGLLEQRLCQRSSVWPSEWVLKGGAK